MEEEEEVQRVAAAKSNSIEASKHKARQQK